MREERGGEERRGEERRGGRRGEGRGGEGEVGEASGWDTTIVHPSSYQHHTTLLAVSHMCPQTDR